MRKDPIESPEDASQVLNTIVLQRQPAREELGASKHGRRMVQRMGRVVDGATTLRRVMDRAQVLPFAGAHLRTRGGSASVVQESDDEDV